MTEKYQVVSVVDGIRGRQKGASSGHVDDGRRVQPSRVINTLNYYTRITNPRSTTGTPGPRDVMQWRGGAGRVPFTVASEALAAQPARARLLQPLLPIGLAICFSAAWRPNGSPT